jgi:phage terminase large subunit GpA-like protein
MKRDELAQLVYKYCGYITGSSANKAIVDAIKFYEKRKIEEARWIYNNSEERWISKEDVLKALGI